MPLFPFLKGRTGDSCGSPTNTGVGHLYRRTPPCRSTTTLRAWLEQYFPGVVHELADDLSIQPSVSAHKAFISGYTGRSLMSNIRFVFQPYTWWIGPESYVEYGDNLIPSRIPLAALIDGQCS